MFPTTSSIQPGRSLYMEANGKKDFDKERASIESKQKEDIAEKFASIIGEFNSTKCSKKECSKKDLKNIFQRSCQLESAASSKKWSLRQPKSIRLVNESIDRYTPLKGASKSDVLAGTAWQNINGFCQSREGKKLYRKVCANNFYTIESFMRQINSNISLNNRNSKKQTPLILASLNGHWDLVKTMIDNDCGVIASYHNNEEDVLSLILEDKMNLEEKAKLVKKIILSGTYVNSDHYMENCYKHTMRKIAEYGDTELLQRLLGELDVRQPDKLLAEHMLRIAASSDHNTADMIRYLLSLKKPDGMQLVNPMSHGFYNRLPGEHALILAAEKGNVNQVKALLTDPLVESKINLPRAETPSYTAYCAASCKPYVEVQRILIEHGADIHELNKFPSTGCCASFFSSDSTVSTSSAALTSSIISSGALL